MLALFTLQSPTLLNILATSKQWQLEVMIAETGLAEAAQLTAPAWGGRYPDKVFVCSPDHLELARTVFPRSEHWWVAHNGKDIGPIDAPTLALSERVAAIQRSAGVKDVRVIVPHYSVAPAWKWEPGHAWSMLSRPSSRHPKHVDNLVQLATHHPIELYGQDQPMGFLDAKGKEALFKACSCYASPLPPWAGFGLAQHECFAAGVPLVGSRWGDMPKEARPAWTSLDDDAEAQGRSLVRLCTERAYAEAMSVFGLELIEKHRSFERMEQSIASAIS